MNDIKFDLNRSLVTDLIHNECEADVLVDVLRSSGYNHETATITINIVDAD